MTKRKIRLTAFPDHSLPWQSGWCWSFLSQAGLRWPLCQPRGKVTPNPRREEVPNNSLDPYQQTEVNFVSLFLAINCAESFDQVLRWCQYQGSYIFSYQPKGWPLIYGINYRPIAHNLHCFHLNHMKIQAHPFASQIIQDQNYWYWLTNI